MSQGSIRCSISAKHSGTTIEQKVQQSLSHMHTEWDKMSVNTIMLPVFEDALHIKLPCFPWKIKFF